MCVHRLMCGFLNIGNISYEIGEYESAMHCYKNYHELYGSTSDSYNRLTRVYHCLKEYDQAIELYKKVIAIY
jgi:tetratricopeptide (TPR) repeat protein